MDALTVVTGGAGFIGSHLVENLVGRGRRVRVVERPGANAGHLPAGVEVVRADIRDRQAVIRAVQGARWVYHLAANPNLVPRDFTGDDVPISIKLPFEVFVNRKPWQGHTIGWHIDTGSTVWLGLPGRGCTSSR